MEKEEDGPDVGAIFLSAVESDPPESSRAAAPYSPPHCRKSITHARTDPAKLALATASVHSRPAKPERRLPAKPRHPPAGASAGYRLVAATLPLLCRLITTLQKRLNRGAHQRLTMPPTSAFGFERMPVDGSTHREAGAFSRPQERHLLFLWRGGRVLGSPACDCRRSLVGRREGSNAELECARHMPCGTHARSRERDGRIP
jgi:hypothetical protein